MHKEGREIASVLTSRACCSVLWSPVAICPCTVNCTFTAFYAVNRKVPSWSVRHVCGSTALSTEWRELVSQSPGGRKVPNQGSSICSASLPLRRHLPLGSSRNGPRTLISLAASKDTILFFMVQSFQAFMS